MANYKITKDQYHRLWDERHPAILHIESGDTVDIEIPEVTGDFFDINSTIDDLNAFDGNLFYPLAGPIYVDAYLLCSLCADLKITEVVDGELMVTAMLPLGIFK